MSLPVVVTCDLGNPSSEIRDASKWASGCVGLVVVERPVSMTSLGWQTIPHGREWGHACPSCAGGAP